jgi:hypothetical protein
MGLVKEGLPMVTEVRDVFLRSREEHLVRKERDILLERFGIARAFAR